jgi:type IV secretory pathway VirB2 component (pilin)
MDLKARQYVPIVYGAIVAVLWATVQGPVAMTFTVVGGIALGLYYATGGHQRGESGGDSPTGRSGES